MARDENDAGLVARARRGNKEAYGELYEQYLDSIFRYIYYRVGDVQDAEDLTEQVFLNAWEGLHQYQKKVPFKAWLFRIAHNTVVDHYRRKKDLVSLSDNGDISATELDIEEGLLRKEAATQLAGVLERLSPLHQHVLVLRFINGLSMQDAAQVLDRNVGAIRVLQHRALKAAHAFLEAEEVTDV